jgi:hypothetical protein
MTPYPPVTFWATPPAIDGRLIFPKAERPERSLAHTLPI